MVPLRFHRGIELPQHGLWLDPHDAQPFAFVSHAHADHIADHREIIATPGTARLMDARMPGTRKQHLLPYGERREFDGFAATLLPAGHIFGSAQIFLESDAGTLLYTGDFKLRESLSAEPTEWRQADTLIMETTYGLPKYRMPPTDEVIAQMVAFCQEALEENAVPVLLGYSLGKSQEILCALLKAGLTPMLHGSVYRMTELYRELRPDFPEGYVRYAAGQVQGKVIVCPPSAARSLMIQRIKNRRTAVLTGWALDPGAKFRYGCDAAFPLTDHADYPDLVRYVELVQPKLVLTLHGFASDFARDLRERGFEAWALSQENQLELSLSGGGARSKKAMRGELEMSQSDVATTEAVGIADLVSFGRLGEEISATSSKLKKIALLSVYLKQLAEIDPAHASVAATFLTGRPFAQMDNRKLQIGWAVIRRALIGASGKPEAEIREVSRRHNDAGKTAHEVLLGATVPEPFSLEDARLFFDSLHTARGPVLKGELVQERLARLDPLAGSYIVRILTGDLRIGLREGLVEDAIASAFQQPGEAIREANMLLGDIGETARLAARGALHEATLTLFRPIKCMLASPEPTAEAIWDRMAEGLGDDTPQRSVATAVGESSTGPDATDSSCSNGPLGRSPVAEETELRSDVELETPQRGVATTAGESSTGPDITDSSCSNGPLGRSPVEKDTDSSDDPKPNTPQRGVATTVGVVSESYHDAPPNTPQRGVATTVGVIQNPAQQGVATTAGESSTGPDITDSSCSNGPLGSSQVAEETELRSDVELETPQRGVATTVGVIQNPAQQGVATTVGEISTGPDITDSSCSHGPLGRAHMSTHTYWVEDKFDGIRAQVHTGNGEARIFTRDLRDVTEQFADVVRPARELGHDAILDGEILAFEAGRKLTFFDLQKRLGRKQEEDLFLGRSDVPVIFRAFDLLWLDGESFLRHPLSERRARLETIAFPQGMELAPITLVHSAADIEAAFRTARLNHNEGLIAKDGSSLYTPGRRGLSWLKLKKELATLDVVVVGAEVGHGKRSGVLSDYTFAVRDDENGELLVIGKAYSGVTDEEIDELTEHFLGSTVKVMGNFRLVRPEIVFEVAFDSINPSTRHASGLALRFPRIKSIRKDKTPAEIDTLAFARSLVNQIEPTRKAGA